MHIPRVYDETRSTYKLYIILHTDCIYGQKDNVPLLDDNNIIHLQVCVYCSSGISTL